VNLVRSIVLRLKRKRGNKLFAAESKADRPPHRSSDGKKKKEKKEMKKVKEEKKEKKVMKKVKEEMMKKEKKVKEMEEGMMKEEMRWGLRSLDLAVMLWDWEWEKEWEWEKRWEEGSKRKPRRKTLS